MNQPPDRPPPGAPPMGPYDPYGQAPQFVPPQPPPQGHVYPYPQGYPPPWPQGPQGPAPSPYPPHGAYGEPPFGVGHYPAPAASVGQFIPNTWAGYDFPEESVPTSLPLLKIEPSLPLPKELAELAPFNAIDDGFNKTLERLNVHWEAKNTAPQLVVFQSSDRPRTWLNCSPFEIFLVDVLAEKLKSL